MDSFQWPTCSHSMRRSDEGTEVAHNRLHYMSASNFRLLLLLISLLLATSLQKGSETRDIWNESYENFHFDIHRSLLTRELNLKKFQYVFVSHFTQMK